MKASARKRLRWGTALVAGLGLWGAGCGSEELVTQQASQIQQGTTINIADGTVEGDLDGGSRRWRGIPYAAPPIGERRWRPPAPPVPWTGVRQATAFGSACSQLPAISGTPSEEEDCLYLNVWSPDPAPTAPLPVMLWFHGGANQSGSAGDPVPFGVGGDFYSGRTLVERHNVVVVTINYRLGVFGFFAHPALEGEDSAYPYAGNQGLLDQRAALEWVRKNIGPFGGDPDNVTIFGESAGSFDTCFQVVSPGSRGLFHRAISESGGCTTRQRTLAEAETQAEQLSATVGCDTADDTLGCLRQVAVAELLEKAGADFGPIIDGGFLPDQPRALFAAGDFAKVPYILGSNSDEGTLFSIGETPVTTEEEYLAALEERYGALADQVAAVYPVANFASPQDALVRVFGDSALVCPTYDTARRAAAGGSAVWLYNFARPVQGPLASLHLGATHGAEISYVFGSADYSDSPDDEALVNTIEGYWTRHARDGDPNGEGATDWPRYDDASDQRLNLDVQPSVLTGFRRPECEFWWGVYDSEFE
jgi:para-nitrobenzyl esterase